MVQSDNHFNGDQPSPPPITVSSSEKHLILIVDDLINNLRLLRDTLLEQGYDVRSTTKGSTVLKVSKLLHPDLILLDIKMPDINGFEVSFQLKSDPETHDIPIIFLSAMSDINHQGQAFESGGIDFIAKPFQVQEVLMRVKNHLTIKKLQDDLYQQNQQLQEEIQQRKLIEQALYAEKELAQITLKSIGDGVITTDENGYINDLNPVAERLTGYPLSESKGQLINSIFSIVDEVSSSLVENPVNQALKLGKMIMMQESSLLIARDQKEYVIDYNASPIKDHQQNIIGAILVFRDITESRNLSRQLSWQATHDNLTQLLNKTAFEQKLRQTLASVQETQEHHVLCYLDLDKFKIVNDTCGHLAGDELLKQLTSLLAHQIRSGDTFARLGGDEFALLLHHCPLEKAISIANHLKETVQSFRFIWEHKTFSISVSIGLVKINQNSQDINSVLKSADIACFQAKEQGRNCVQIYQESLQNIKQYQTGKKWINRIEEALAENQFCLYSQEIVPLNGHVSLRFQEILLRLKDEKNNIILPMAFIPTAERYHLMPRIDQWVISTFLKQFEEYSFTNYQDKLYSINLSGTSLNNPQFCHFIEERLSKISFLCQFICFEITETTAITHLNQVAIFIQKIKALGCRFALDDLGSSMNSFAYLKQIPLDYLKIERTLIQSILDDPVNYIMVESIHQISQVLQMQTIAEGIDSQKLQDTLQSIGINYGQGYAISQPHPFLK